MDYEQKYKETLERAKKLQETCNSTVVVGWCEYIFPELKESEDELTWLTKYIEEEAYWLSLDIRDDEDRIKLKKLQESLAWLEKQGKKNPAFEMKTPEESLGIDSDTYNEIVDECIYGEQKSQRMISAEAKEAMYDKPADKIEPKFKVGEWITHNTANFVFKIINVGSNGYEVVNRENYKKTISFDNEDNYHLWTIQDVKDGDVLADDNLPFIFKKVDSMMHSYAYCGISVDDGFKIESEGESGEWTWMQDIKPATKEQRDTLLKAMTDAGYTFDFDKKELEKIEQKPAWSEEDDMMIEETLYFLREYQQSNRCKDESGMQNSVTCEKWLKSLKERINGKQ